MKIEFELVLTFGAALPSYHDYCGRAAFERYGRARDAHLRDGDLGNLFDDAVVQRHQHPHVFISYLSEKVIVKPESLEARKQS